MKPTFRSFLHFLLVAVGTLALPSGLALGHPMPNSVLLLDIRQKGIACELQLPVDELELAWNADLHSQPDSIIPRYGGRLAAYLQAHIHPVGDDGSRWPITVGTMELKRAEQTDTGPYRELAVGLWFQPPAGASTRRFTLYYDAIIHQLVTHKALVAIRQDWENGKVGDAETEVGSIALDPRDNSIFPLRVNLDEGSLWRGFRSMVSLGISHITEGTDHLLFLLVLLLPAPLLVAGGRWKGFGGARYSTVRLLKITSAFTIGHSLTLLAGAVGWLRLPSAPVEILIAISILVTAIHAIRPWFAGNEIYVAGGFGLVHGLAFAGTLAGLGLEPGRMALSILGFNIGIELMQLFVVLMTVPWLIMLAERRWYSWIRIGGATLAGVAAVAWIVERWSGSPNAVASLAATAGAHGKWIVLGLAALALASHWWKGAERAETTPNHPASAYGQ